MDGTRGLYAKWSKAGTERQMLCVISLSGRAW
jgi:hypothetical protein